MDLLTNYLVLDRERWEREFTAWVQCIHGCGDCEFRFNEPVEIDKITGDDK